MKLIYVAGPYRGKGDNDVWQHIMAARYWARCLWEKGWAVFCPHTNTLFMDGPEIPVASFLDGDLEILRRCDAVFMVPGWEGSKGASAERDRADELLLPVYYDLSEIPDGRG